MSGVTVGVREQGTLRGCNEKAWVRRSKLKCYDGQIEKHGVGERRWKVLLAEYLTSEGGNKK